MGLAVDDIVALTYESTVASQQIRYNLHYIVTTAGGSTTPELDLQAMADSFNSTLNSVTNAIQAVSSDTDWNLNAVTAQRVFPTRTIRLVSTGSTPGVAAANSEPPNVAAVITKRTLTPGRSGLGSLHLSGVPQGWITAGEIDPINVPAYNPLLSALIASQTVAAVSMVVAPGLFHPLIVPTPFSRLFDCILQVTSRVMRRRTVRVGI